LPYTVDVWEKVVKTSQNKKRWMRVSKECDICSPRLLKFNPENSEKYWRIPLFLKGVGTLLHVQ
jgi:hypothetical protein